MKPRTALHDNGCSRSLSNSASESGASPHQSHALEARLLFRLIARRGRELITRHGRAISATAAAAASRKQEFVKPSERSGSAYLRAPLYSLEKTHITKK